MIISPLENILNITLKRSLDVLFSLIVIVFLLSWFIPIISIIIKLTSKGPIFFIQERSGKDGIPFNCIKLRSMRPNDLANYHQATENDIRITWIGKFLRKFSLDELPQFVNVLLGQMSIIGPRPHMLKHTEAYSEIVEDYMKRLHVKPGITGLSQVMGYRGEIKNNLMIANRVRLDIFYIKKWSIGLDIQIALRTVRLVIHG